VNSSELIEAVRQDVFIDESGTAFPDYSDDRLFIECTDALRTVFSRSITQARQGYWQKQSFVTVSAQTAKYQIPFRAVSGGLEQVALSDGGKYVKLEEVTETHAQDFELAPSTYGQPKKYCIRGDQIVLLPSPNGSYTLRITYYLRPSALYAPQTAAGIVTDVNPTTRLITVGSLPTNRVTSATLATGALIDVIHPGGWHEVGLVGATASLIVGNVITVGGTDSLDEVRVGDYVRAAEQTDWPCLPEDHHRTLAKVVAVTVCQQLHLMQKASELTTAANSGLQAFVDLLASRVKAEAPVLKAPMSVMQVGRGQRGFFGWR
jgi:hypothetical protein